MDTNDSQNQPKSSPDSTPIPDLSSLMNSSVDSSVSQEKNTNPLNDSPPQNASSTSDTLPPSTDTPSSPPSDPPVDQPQKKKFNKGILVALLLFFLITIPLLGIFVNQSNQIADIRNRAVYPGCACKSENAVCGGSLPVTRVDIECPSGQSCCPGGLPTNTPIPPICAEALQCAPNGNSGACCAGSGSLDPKPDSSCGTGFRCPGGLCRQDCLADNGNNGDAGNRLTDAFCNQLPGCSCNEPGNLTGTCTSVIGGSASCLGQNIYGSCTFYPNQPGSGICMADGGSGPNWRCVCSLSCGGGGPGPTNTPRPTATPTPTGVPPTGVPPTNTPVRTPTPTPTRTPTPTITLTPTAGPSPTPTSTPTNTPTPTNGPSPTPTNTPVIGQCQNIKVYKDGQVVNPSTLRRNDVIVIAVVGTNATQARIKINGEPDWRMSTTTNSAGEWVFNYQIPDDGTLSFSIVAELFIAGVWM